METVYITGKVTGLDYDKVREKFEQAEIKLLEKGYQVVNPTKLANKHDDWDIAMRKCLLGMLEKCNAIFLLDDWKDSPGGRLEYQIANKLGFKNITNI